MASILHQLLKGREFKTHINRQQKYKEVALSNPKDFRI